MIRFYYIFILLVFMLNYNASGESIRLDTANMYYILDKIDFESFKSDTDFYNYISACKPLNIAGLDIESLRGKNQINLVIHLPEANIENPAISMFAFLDSFRVYHKRNMIYDSKSTASKMQKTFLINHLVKLDSSMMGDIVIISIGFNNMNEIGSIIEMQFGELDNLYYAMQNKSREIIRGAFLTQTLGSYLIFMSFGFLIFYFISRNKSKDLRFVYLSIFLFASGLQLLNDRAALLYTDITPIFYINATVFTLYLIPIGFFGLLQNIYKYKFNRVLKWIFIFHIAALIISFVLSAFFEMAFLMLNLFRIIFFIEGIASFFIISYNYKYLPKYLKAFTIGIYIFLVLTFFEVFIRPDDLNLSNIDLFSISLLILMHFIAYSLFKEFTISFAENERIKNELEKQKTDNIKLERENLLSRYSVLMNQLNPHFLFNTFSVLITIIEEDKELAVRFVQELSNVYRYTLVNRDKDLIELKYEVEFLEAFVFLLKMRYGNNLTVNINIDKEKYDFYIPTLSLQLLVENAVKHNKISSRDKLIIDINSDDIYLNIKNKINKKISLKSDTKVGLQNIINRYDFFTEKQVLVQEDSQYFTVKIPLIESI